MSLYSALLLDVADLLEKGWHKGSYAADANSGQTDLRDSKACSFCLHGAMLKLGVPVDLERIVVKELEGSCPWLQKRDKFFNRIVLWNDYPDRTKEEVLSFVRGLAKKLDMDDNYEDSGGML